MKFRSAPASPHTQSKRVDTDSLTLVLGFVRPYRWQFVAALCALFVGSSLNLVFPEVVRRALEPTVFPTVLQHLPLLFGFLAALFIVQGGAFFVRSLLFGLLGQRVYNDVRRRLFQSVVQKGIPFFDDHRSGDLAARLNSDAALVQDLVSVKLSVILRYGVQVLFGTVLMAWMSWRMTAAIVASVVCIVVVSSVFVRSLRAASRRFQSELAKLTAFAAESFGGIEALRALGAERSVQRSFDGGSEAVLRAGEGRVRVSSAFSSGASLLLNVLLLGVVWYGVSLVLHDRLPINDLAAFGLYGSIVAVSFAFLVSAYAEVVSSLGGLDRVFELFGEEPACGGTESGIITAVGPKISFHRVSFAYPTREKVGVLDDLTLTIPAGKVVGIMGPSGAGKSSLVRLLLRFYEPQAGSISVNDRSLGEVSETELRDRVAWVPQDPLLFGLSIYDNVTLGSPMLQRADVEARLREWGFIDFVWDLPDGLLTILGERGTQLSGGQRQRLAIARALLRNPSLLLLDEATSALDSELEAQVLAIIRAVLPSATLVVVSHRLTTIQRADSIFVINEGRVVEQGTHHDLKNAAGLYHHYTSRQTIT